MQRLSLKLYERARKTKGEALVCGVLFSFGGLSTARAEILEDSILFATQSSQFHLFPLNPAVHKSAKTEGGVLAVRSSKSSKLDQAATGDDVIESDTNDDGLAFGALVDIGAGAGLGLTHQNLYRKVETNLTSRDDPRPIVELLKQQHSMAKIVVELTDELRAGMAIRYLYKDALLSGSPNVGNGEETRYKTTLVGYGSGFAAYFKSAGIAYAYYPPLRGKAEIYGEEKIIVEPGEIVVDAFVRPTDEFTIGLLGKRWLHELDDRAPGTTSSDNETNISLYGLDPDQYLFQDRLLMIGAEYKVNQQASIGASAGQEEAKFDFINLLRYSGIDVQQTQASADETIKYNRFRVLVKFVNQGIELSVGGGMFTRKHDFPQNMNAAHYESSGRELFTTISLQL